MKKILIIILVTGWFGSLYRIDYTCFNDCLRQGYSYSYCKAQCSY